MLMARNRQGLKQLKIVSPVFISILLGFVGTEIALLGNYWPFAAYWSLPPISSKHVLAMY